ncbi:MAG: alpha/beta fold hydrolase [Roseinatronobacter sp.]
MTQDAPEIEAPFFAACSDAPPANKVIWRSASDGVRLRIALWPAGPRGVVALFPGRTEMIEKYGRVVRDLAAAGYGAAVIDWRGQGLSDRVSTDPLLGHVEDFAHFQRDVAVFRATLDTFAPDAPRFVLAHSMGGCIALRALIQGFPARAAAFSAPMWGLNLSGIMQRSVQALGFLLGAAGRDLRAVPGAGIEFRLWENPFSNNDLTTDRDTYAWMQAQLIAHPELRLGAPSLRWLLAGLRETAALAALPSPPIPAHCGLGTREILVSPDAIRNRIGRWKNGTLEIHDGALHELLMERPAIRAAFMDDMLRLFDHHAPQHSQG